MEREQVIKGMEEVVRDFKDEIEEWGFFTPDEMRGGISVDCDWYYGVMQKCKAGLEMLKRDAPRVLTLDEVITSKPGTVVWLEDFNKPDVISGLLKRLFIYTKVIDFLIVKEEVNNEVTADLDVYGSGWRCWTSRPTDNQKKATPWRGE